MSRLGLLQSVSTRLADGRNRRNAAKVAAASATVAASDESEAGFFSQAVKAANELQRKSGNADGFYNDLTGKGQVKPDELNAMGFKDYFAGRKDIPRSEIQEFINAKQFNLKETLLDDRIPPNSRGFRSRKEFESYLTDYENMLDDLLIGNDDGYVNEADFIEKRETYDRLKEEYDAAVEFGSRETFFGNNRFQMDGAEDYRETLLQRGEMANLTNAEAEDILVNMGLRHYDDKEPLSEAEYNRTNSDHHFFNEDHVPFIKTSHFGQNQDILASIRATDRRTPNNDKVYYMDEVQSDLHQKGQKQGYRLNKKEIDLLEQELAELNNSMEKERGRKVSDDLSAAEYRTERTNRQFRLVEMSRKGSKLEREIKLNKNLENGLPPNVPFKTDDKSSWYNLALKKGLNDAVDGDYDYLALPRGGMVADIYGQRDYINNIQVKPSKFDYGNTGLVDLEIHTENGRHPDRKTFNSTQDLEAALPKLIGKENAKKYQDKIADGSPEPPVYDENTWVTANKNPSYHPDTMYRTGLDREELRQYTALFRSVYEDSGPQRSSDIERIQELQRKIKVHPVTKVENLKGIVGGDANTEFYDNVLPRNLNKIVKQDGVKTELLDVGLANNSANRKRLSFSEDPDMRVNAVKLTPELKERVKKGLPLFSGAGALAMAPDDTFADMIQQREDTPVGQYPTQDVADYNRSKLLPTLGSIGQGVLEAGADTLDYLSPENLGRLVADPGKEGLGRFVSDPVSSKYRDMISPITDAALFDKRDPRYKELVRNSKAVGGLISPL